MTELRGYAHIPGDRALDRPEVLARGALWPWLAEDRSTKLLMEHDPDHVLASRARGHLELFEDDIGLGFRAVLPREYLDVAVDVSRRRLGCSIGGQRILRSRGDTIELAMITEISLTREPAYPGAAVWCADDDERDQHPRLAELRRCWRAGYRAGPQRPRRCGNEFIDARNGYTTAAPKPRPSAPPPAAARRPQSGYLATLMRGWRGQPMVICHRGVTRRALGSNAKNHLITMG